MTPNKARCIVVIFSCRCCDSIYEAIQEHTKDEAILTARNVAQPSIRGLATTDFPIGCEL